MNEKNEEKTTFLGKAHNILEGFMDFMISGYYTKEEYTKFEHIFEDISEKIKENKFSDSEFFDEFFKKIEELFDLTEIVISRENEKRNKIVVKTSKNVGDTIKEAKDKIKLLEIAGGSFDSVNAYGNIISPFQNWDWLAVIKRGEFGDYAFYKQSGIVKVNGGTFGYGAFSRQSGIVKVNGGRFENDAFSWQSGIVKVNDGEFGDNAFYGQSGIVKVNGGRFENNAFWGQSGIVKVNGGEFGDNAFYGQSGIVKVGNGKFNEYAFSEQSGIVEVNRGRFEGRVFNDQSGVVEINDGEFGSAFYNNKGFVKINGGKFEGTRTKIAHNMKDGLLYITDSYIPDIGDMNEGILGGVVIAPYKIRRIWNRGGTVFATENAKDVIGSSIIFTGEVEIGDKTYYSSDVLKAFGDYVWGRVKEEYSKKVQNKEGKWVWNYEAAKSVVDKIKLPKSIKKGDAEVVKYSLKYDVKDILKDYKPGLEGLEEAEVEKGIGEAVYNYFSSEFKKDNLEV